MSEPELLIGTKGGPNSRVTEVVRLVNSIRQGRSLHLLTPGPKLSKAAAARARHLASIEVLTHDGWEKALAFAGVSARSVGENIAMGFKSADAVVTAWMNSPGHRRNILDPDYRFIGVAAAIDDDDDTFWCQLFASK